MARHIFLPLLGLSLVTPTLSLLLRSVYSVQQRQPFDVILRWGFFFYVWEQNPRLYTWRCFGTSRWILYIVVSCYFQEEDVKNERETVGYFDFLFFFQESFYKSGEGLWWDTNLYIHIHTLETVNCKTFFWKERQTLPNWRLCGAFAKGIDTL